MTLTNTYTFESGSDGTAFSVGTEDTVATSGAKYNAAAAVHGSMGVSDAVGSTGSAGWSVGSQGQVSLYWPGYTIGTGNGIMFTLREGGNIKLRLRGNTTSGKYEITDSANAVLATSTTSLSATTPARTDWRWEWNGTTGVVTLTIRLFIGANIEGSVPDEVLGPVTTTLSPSLPLSRFYLGTTSSSWQIMMDTLRIYDDVTTWPESFVVSAPPPDVVYAMSGNIRETTAQIKVKITDSTTNVAKCYYSVNSDLSSPSTTVEQSVDADGYATFDLTGLTGDTKYYYSFYDVDGATDTPIGGTYSFRTVPASSGLGTLKLAIGACVMTAASNTFPKDALSDIVTWDPHILVHLGDAYYNGLETNTVESFHLGRWEMQIDGIPEWATLLGSVGFVYTNSDHELNPDNVDTGSNTNALTFNEFYRKRIPSHPLVVAGANPVSKHQSWVDSGIRFILIDVRNTQRTAGATAQGPTKTMLGASQLAWLLSELDQPELLKVILCDVPWTGAAATTSLFKDKWCSYDDERQTIADHITTNGINVDFFHGDSHRLSVDETHNTWGGFPYTSCAPLSQDSGGTQFNGYWDQSYPTEGSAQINMSGYMRVTYEWLDSNTLQRTASGWDAVNDLERVSMVTTWVRGAAPVTTTYVNVGGVATPVSTFINVAGTAVETAAVTVAP